MKNGVLKQTVRMDFTVEDRCHTKVPDRKPDAGIGASSRGNSSDRRTSLRPSVAVVGGGAAGMMAAVSAAEAGAEVTVFDKNERAGRKLGLTGKGRCNLTNNCAVPAFIENVLRNGRFLYPAVCLFPPSAVMDYFENVLHVPLKTERGGRVFPVSDRAGDIVYALVRQMRRLGCVYLQDEVLSLEADPETGAVLGLRTASGPGRLLPFDRVIVCVGGASYPSTGSAGDGLRLAGEMGMETAPFSPSLIPLLMKEDCCREMQGLSLRNVFLAPHRRRKRKNSLFLPRRASVYPFRDHGSSRAFRVRASAAGGRRRAFLAGRTLPDRA